MERQEKELVILRHEAATAAVAGGGGAAAEEMRCVSRIGLGLLCWIWCGWCSFTCFQSNRDEKLLKLQRKMQRLQEELTDKLRCVGTFIYRNSLGRRLTDLMTWCSARLEVQGATSQLNLTKEIQDLFQKWQAARAECAMPVCQKRHCMPLADL